MNFFKKVGKSVLILLISLAIRAKSPAVAFDKDSAKNSLVNSIFEKRLQERNNLKNFRKNMKSSSLKINEINLSKNSFLKMNLDNPSWISGFTDGEGCFSVSFTRREKMNTGIEARPSFALGQNKQSREALEGIQKYFNCGSIRYSAADGCYKYEVRNLNDLITKVIPHYEKYPLKTHKKIDFETFSSVCKEMKQNKHLNVAGLQKIINESYTMNSAGTRKYSREELMKYIKKKD